MARRVSVSSVSSAKRIGKAYEYDPDFKGPRDRRSCTDVICLLLFIAFLAAWGCVGFYAYMYGDPNRILQPTDFSGRKCGVDRDVAKKPYLLFFDLTLCARSNVLVDGCSSPSVCVEKCPEQNFNAEKFYSRSSMTGVQPICLPNTTVHDGPALRLAVNTNKCAKWYLKSVALGKFCIPDVVTVADQPADVVGLPSGVSVRDIVKGGELAKASQWAMEAGEKIVSDTVASYPFILGGLACAMVLSLVYILLLRWFTGIIVWSSILMVLAALGVGLYFCYAYWEQLRNGGSVDAWGNVPAEVRTWLDDPTTWLVLLITLAVVLGILLLIVLFLRKRISLAVKLIQQGGEAISSITATLFFPVVPWALQVAVVAYAGTVLLFLATTGEATFTTHGMAGCNCTGLPSLVDGNECHPEEFRQLCSVCVAKGASCLFFRYNPPDYIRWLQVYNVFGVIWALFFISGMAQMILAATFASWYWTLDKDNVPFFVLTRSFFMSITYHSGTVAFGSLIISIVRFIRLILDYIEKQVKQYSDNSVAKCIMCCCKCCFACVEGFLRYVSRNAYIMCAIHGKNFCASAKDAFELLMRNVIRAVVIDKIMDFVFFMGKLLVTALVCTAVYFSLLKWPQDLNYKAVPVTISGVGTFFIASIFFGVYSVAVDTLFLCFLEDCERNDGSREKPYFMTNSLMKTFNKRNRSRESE